MQSPSSIRSSRIAACSFALVVLTCILVATLMPAGPKNELLRPFPAHLHADKLGHFLGSAWFSAALLWTGRVRPAGAIALAVLLGAVTEALQFLAVGRVGRLADIGIDAAGGLLGVALTLAVLRLRALRRPIAR